MATKKTTKTTKSKKPQTDWQKLLSRHVEIDGVKVDDATLAEFLDWELLNGSKDFKMFMHLKNTGYFEENPITPDQLAEAVNEKDK